MLLVAKESQNGAHPLKSESFMGMWGVYPEAIAWNISGVHSDFNFDELIWSSGARRANFIVLFDIGPLWATSPNTLNQIEIWVWVHTANIPGYCLWVDTPDAYVWATGNVHFLMGEPCFEVIFPPPKNLWNPVLANYLFAYILDTPYYTWLNLAPNGSKCLKMASNISKWLQMTPNCSTWPQMAMNSSKRLQMAPNCSKRHQMAPNGSKVFTWLQMDSNGFKCRGQTDYKRYT